MVRTSLHSEQLGVDIALQHSFCLPPCMLGGWVGIIDYAPGLHSTLELFEHNNCERIITMEFKDCRELHRRSSVLRDSARLWAANFAPASVWLRLLSESSTNIQKYCTAYPDSIASIAYV